MPVLSDECYAEFTWDGLPHTILEHGLDGVLAVHSLSKRSNLAGLRVGFYAGDPDLVHYLSEVRKHAGFMVPGPVQAAAAVALDDDAHVDVQRERYLERLWYFADVLRAEGAKVDLPGGSFYLWAAGARRRRVGLHPGLAGAGRRAGVARRPLRPGRRRPRAGGDGAAHGAAGAGGRAPRHLR